jgi:cytochrome P450
MSLLSSLVVAFWLPLGVSLLAYLALNVDSGVAGPDVEYLLDVGAYYVASLPLHTLPRHRLRLLAVAYAALAAAAAVAAVLAMRTASSCRCCGGGRVAPASAKETAKETATEGAYGIPRRRERDDASPSRTDAGAETNTNAAATAAVCWNEASRCFEIRSARLTKSTLAALDGAVVAVAAAAADVNGSNGPNDPTGTTRSKGPPLPTAQAGLSANVLPSYLEQLRRVNGRVGAVGAVRDHPLEGTREEAEEAEEYPELFAFLGAQVLSLDGPRQKQLHSVLRGFLSAARLQELREGGWLGRTVDALLDACVLRAPSWDGATFDFVHDFASRLPLLTILHLCGLPREEIDRVRGWSDTMERWYGGGAADIDVRCAEAAAAVQEFQRMLAPHIARCRRDQGEDNVAGNAPGSSRGGTTAGGKGGKGGKGCREEAGLEAGLEIGSGAPPPHKTLVGALVHAAAEGLIGEDEVAPNVFFMLAAGYETTSSLLSNGLLALLDHPAEMQLLREAVATCSEQALRRRAAASVQELLRYVCPVKRIYRRVAAARGVTLTVAAGGEEGKRAGREAEAVATAHTTAGGATPPAAPPATSDTLETPAAAAAAAADTDVVAADVTTVHRVHMPHGSLVHFIATDCCRDADVFHRGGQLDLRRKNAREHMAFGWGPHACVGMMLGRLEVEVALVMLLQRFPRISLAGPREAVTWKELESMVVLEGLMVTVEAGEDG